MNGCRKMKLEKKVLVKTTAGRREGTFQGIKN